MRRFLCYRTRRVAAEGWGGALGADERRSPDRPAGIRTMAVTALGSASFTLASMYAFQDGPMAWDASRVSAAIPSGASPRLPTCPAPFDSGSSHADGPTAPPPPGVGFLGSGIIWKARVHSVAPYLAVCFSAPSPARRTIWC